MAPKCLLAFPPVLEFGEFITGAPKKDWQATKDSNPDRKVLETRRLPTTTVAYIIGKPSLLPTVYLCIPPSVISSHALGL